MRSGEGAGHNLPVMGQLPDLHEARRRLGLALSPLCHDRWVLGFISEGWVHPIAASEVQRRFLLGRPLTPLGRRALYEKKPAVINSLFEKSEPSDGYNWELDWPAILYTPISQIGQRPIGLLAIGCRRDHWYTEQDVAYAHTLGVTLAPLVAALRGPLGQLNENEGEVAQLLSYGLSTAEIARAIRTDDRQARQLVERVTRKLQSIKPADLEFPIVQMRRRAFRL